MRKKFNLLLGMTIILVISMMPTSAMAYEFNSNAHSHESNYKIYENTEELYDMIVPMFGMPWRTIRNPTYVYFDPGTLVRIGFLQSGILVMETGSPVTHPCGTVMRNIQLIGMFGFSSGWVRATDLVRHFW